MNKPRLTPEQYIAEMNRRLKEHDAYREGMAFVPYPEGATGSNLSGYSFTGPFGLTGIYALIAHQVANDFDLLV